MSFAHIKSCKLVALLLLLILFVSRIYGTTLAQLTLAQLTSAAPIIVKARCTGTESLWHDSEIWTVTSFRAEEIWKGNVSQQFQVWMLGGRVGPVISYVPGAPRFRPGDEVVLFLEPTRSGMLSITAWGEGTFRIFRNAMSGKPRVTQDTASLPSFDPATRRFLSSGIRNWPLEELKARVLVAETDGVLRRGEK